MFSQRDVQPVIDAAELNSGKLILNSDEYFHLSETIITTIEPQYDDYLEILLNQYIRGTLRSSQNVINVGASENAIKINDDYGRLDNYDNQRHMLLLQSMISGNIRVPSEQDTLVQYLQSFGIERQEWINQLDVFYWLFRN